VGYDVLGSDDGVAGFRTPLATLHKFNGFADLFLGTPATGLEDFSVGVAGSIGRVKLVAAWHDFKSEEGSVDFGTEINLVATWPVTKRVTVQAKFADYNADGDCESLVGCVCKSCDGWRTFVPQMQRNALRVAPPEREPRLTSLPCGDWRS